MSKKKPNVIELRDKVSPEIWQVLFWAHHLSYLLNEGYALTHEEVVKAMGAVWDADNRLYEYQKEGQSLDQPS